MTHICVNKLTIIGSDNGLSPGQHQTIIWMNAGIGLIGPLWANFSEILNGFQTFSFTKMHLNISFAKWRPFCLGLNVLRIADFHGNATRIAPGCVHHCRHCRIVGRVKFRLHRSGVFSVEIFLSFFDDMNYSWSYIFFAQYNPIATISVL